MEIQICSNIFIFWLQVLQPIVELYHFKNIKCKISKNLLLMLMAFLLFAKWWKFNTKKTSYIINIYFKISKKMDNVYNDLKEKCKIFQIDLIL